MTRAVSNTTFQIVGGTTITHVVNDTATSPKTASVAHGRSTSQAWTSGTTNAKFDRCWEILDVALDASGTANVTYDLYDLGSVNIGAGAGLDALGQPWTVAEIVGLHVSNKSTSTGNLIVGGDGTTACWNSLFNGDDDAVLVLPPGSELIIWTPADPAYAVADTSNHLLKIAVASLLATFSLTVYARSA